MRPPFSCRPISDFSRRQTCTRYLRYGTVRRGIIRGKQQKHRSVGRIIVIIPSTYRLPGNWYTHYIILSWNAIVCMCVVLLPRSALAPSYTYAHAPVTHWRTHARTRGTYHIYYPMVGRQRGIGGTARAHTTVTSEIMGVEAVGITAVL